MTGSRDTLPAPELPAESRHALIVATTVYMDPVLRRLRSPTQDAAGLAETLGDPTIGGFDVKTVADGTAHKLRVVLEDFLVDRNATDLLLVYISCHGVLDARGRLHFAASDTLTSRLAATGVGSRWLLEQMEDCRARRQVLILDCCFSGAFERGTKAGEVDLGQQLAGHSRGRVVLTASRASEYSFEGEPLGDSVAGSVFTTALLDGLRTGQADVNNDGYISVDEAYDYAFAQARAKGAPQTPQRWVYGAEGESIVLARSPAGMTIGAAPLPEALRAGLESPYPEIRLGAVRVLQQWLDGPDPARMLAARQALHRVVDSDIATVSESARALLEGQTVPPRASGARRLRRPEPGRNRRPDPDIPLTDADFLGINPEDLARLFPDSDGAPLPPASPLEDRASVLVARYLFPTERFRGEWKRHPIFLAKRAALGATAVLLSLFGMPTLLANLDSSAVDDVPTSAGYVIAGAALVWTAWSPAAWHWQRLVLTNKRIMVVGGVLIRRVAMLPLLRVTDMKYEQSPLGRVLNYGTFRLESAGRIDRMRRLPNIPNPNELYLRIVEEMYEPAAVEARLGRDDTDDGATDEVDVD